MKILRPAALAIASSALVLGTAAAGTAATSAAQVPPSAAATSGDEHKQGVNLIAGSLNVAKQLFDRIVADVEADINREGLVKSMREAAWYGHDESKNVLVIKADHNYTADLEGITLDVEYKVGTNPKFRVVVFDSGTVTNNGDGGYVNWAYQGWIDEQDKTVTFEKP